MAMSRFFRKRTRLICFAFLPGLALLALVSFASVIINPTKAFFFSTFSLRNNLPQAVTVTPAGKISGSEKRSNLPYFLNFPIMVRSIKTGRFDIAPGDNRRFIYNWDDITFSEIVVEVGSEKRMIVIDSPKSPPEEMEFNITNINLLPIAPDNIALVTNRTWDSWALFMYIYSGLSFLFFLFAVRWKELYQAWRKSFKPANAH
jgi:hypothetical protein